MKKFIRYILIVTASALLLMALLDAAFTYVYSTSPPRNKIQYIMRLEPQKIDYVFLGSSRTANHIATDEVTRITGKPAINLGMEGAVLQDNLLQLKLLLDKEIKMEKVFVQVDYIYEIGNVSNIANSAALPFIHNDVVSEHLKPQLNNFSASYHIPFYRYLIADFAIGFREFTLTMFKKKPRIDLADGFIPKIGSEKLTKYTLPDSIAKNNVARSAISELCAQNNIKLILFCAPFCSKTENADYIERLKEKLPDLRDYSKAVDDSLFFNCGHLNEQGARHFTRMLVADVLN